MAYTLDQAIEMLDLADRAKDAAYELKASNPGVVFTSGRRDTTGQAAAMAKNIVKAKSRTWIRDTYVQSPVREACQKWVDQNPGATSSEDLAAGLEEVLDAFDESQLGRLSKHLSGLAFDVQSLPEGEKAEQLKKAIRELDGLDKFIENEGGLVVWHAQFVE